MMKNLCFAALILAGCVVDERVEVTTQAQLGDDDDDKCNDLVCPGNSDLLGLLGPYELDGTGVQLNSRGFRLAKVTKGFGLGAETLADFQVIGAKPVAHNANGVTLAGPNLIGVTLHMEHQSGGIFKFVIEDYLSNGVPFYAGGASQIDGFYIRYTEPDSDVRKELCPYAELDLGLEGTWAVFWKGDRIEPKSGQIFASNVGVGPWFNLSCAGQADVKMLREKQGGAVNPLGPVKQRQATLNMFTASYCGPGGGRFTQLGELIQWSNLAGTSQIDVGTTPAAMAVPTYEAIWKSSGAVCLNLPRLWERNDVVCTNGHPVIPYCTAEQIASWSLSGDLLSRGE